MAKKYPVTFTVVLSEANGSTICTEEVCVNIEFAPIDIKPTIILDLEHTEIQYDSQMGEVKVGQLVIYNELRNKENDIVQLSYAAPFHLYAKLGLYTNDHPVENVAYFKSPQNLRYDYEEVMFVESGRENVRKCDIYMDFTSIKNPVNAEQEYIIEIEQANTAYSMNFSPDIRVPLNGQWKKLKLKKV